MHPDPELLAVARRVVWFKEPHQTLRNEVFFLNHAMTYGDVSDVVTVRKLFDDEALRDALRHAHPGIFAPRSWAYWHTVLSMSPAPPLPVRRLIEMQDTDPCRDGLSGRGRDEQCPTGDTAIHQSFVEARRHPHRKPDC